MPIWKRVMGGEPSASQTRALAAWANGPSPPESLEHLEQCLARAKLNAKTNVIGYAQTVEYEARPSGGRALGIDQIRDL